MSVTIDLSDVDTDEPHEVLALVNQLRAQAEQEPIVILGCPQMVAHTLYKVGALTSGRIVRGKVRVRRKKDVIYEGVTQSLRRFQDEVNEVRAGMECGIRIEGFGDFEVGDVIECYAIEKIAAKL